MTGPLTAGSLHSLECTFQHHINDANSLGENDPSMFEHVVMERQNMNVMFVKEVSKKDNLTEDDGITARSNAMLVDGTTHKAARCLLGVYMSAVDKPGQKNASIMYELCPMNAMVPVTIRNVVVVVVLEHEGEPFHKETNRFSRVRVAATKRMIVKPCPQLYNAPWFKRWIDLSPSVEYPIPSPPMEDNNDAALPRLVVRIKGIERFEKDNVELHVVIKDTSQDVVMTIHDTRKMFQTQGFEKWIGKTTYIGTNKGLVAKNVNDYMVPSNCGIMSPDIYEKLLKISYEQADADDSQPTTWKKPTNDSDVSMPPQESAHVIRAREALSVAEAKLRSVTNVTPRVKAEELKKYVEEKRRCKEALTEAMQQADGDDMDFLEESEVCREQDNLGEKLRAKILMVAHTK